MIKYSNYRELGKVEVPSEWFPRHSDEKPIVAVDVTKFFFFKKKDLLVFHYGNYWRDLKTGAKLRYETQIDELRLANKITEAYEKSNKES